jgi:hypothetical protein
MSTNTGKDHRQGSRIEKRSNFRSYYMPGAVLRTSQTIDRESRIENRPILRSYYRTVVSATSTSTGQTRDRESRIEKRPSLSLLLQAKGQCHVNKYRSDHRT